MPSEGQSNIRAAVRSFRAPSARRHGGRIERLDLESVNRELRYRLSLLEEKLGELGRVVDARLRTSYLR